MLDESNLEILKCFSKWVCRRILNNDEMRSYEWVYRILNLW